MAIDAQWAFVSETWLLPGALAAIMFAIGLELRPQAFLSEAVRGRPLAAGLLGMALLVPATGVLVASAWAPTPAIAVGLILLATCPVGILAPLVTDLCRGSAPLAISLTVLVSGLYVIAAPFVAHHAIVSAFGVSQAIDAPAGPLLLKVLLVTVAPVSLGLLAQQLWPRLRKSAAPVKSAMSLVLIVVFGIIVLRQWRALTETMGWITGLVLLLNLINLAIALAITRVFRIRGSDATAIIICHLMRQEGTAIFIAVSVLGVPEIALPLIINTFIGILVCGALLRPLRARGGRLDRVPG